MKYVAWSLQERPAGPRLADQPSFRAKEEEIRRFHPGPKVQHQAAA